MRIGLLRHAPTEWNTDGRLQGQTDTTLTDAARVELDGLMLPEGWRGARVIASTLCRARETAERLTGTPPRTDPRLVEVDIGRWVGLRGTDLRDDPESGFRDVEDWGWDYAPHGGESPRDLWRRVEPALREIAGSGADTLIVTHRVVMRTVLAVAHGWDFDGPAPFTIKRRRIYPLFWTPNGPRPAGEPERLVPRCG